MGVVIAIDPGRRQGRAIARLTADLQGHDIVVAASGDEAVDLLDLHVPDLFLFPLCLSPGDDARLRAQLDGLSSPADLKTLTLPLRAFFDGEAQASRPAAVPPRWFYWFKPESPAGYDLEDPHRFADAVRREVSRPRPGAQELLRDGVPAFPKVVAQPPVPGAADVPPPAGVFPQAPEVTSAPLATAAQAPAPPPAALSEVAGRGDETWTTAVSRSPDVDLALSLESTIGEADEPQPGRFAVVLAAVRRIGTALGPAAAAAWRLALGMPRATWVAVPVLVILLTLGVTGRAGSVLRLPGRWAAAAKARFFPDKPATGTAEIQSVPDGAEVWMNGRQIGATPMKAEFAVGSHEVELRHKGTTRSLILDVLPGATVVQRIEWAAPRAAVGRLRVESDPPGAIVAVDGKARGVTPLNVDDLAAGRHSVDLTLRGNTVHETVDIRATRTTTLRTSVYQGWLALFSPIDVNVASDGRPVTLDDHNRVLLPAGEHELTLQNRELGFTATQTIAIRPGDTTAVSVTLPKTAFTVTASGPAEVFLDGNRIGDVPIVDFDIDIGTHDVLVRSPEHGERRFAITATVDPVRLEVDLAASAP